MPSSQTIHPSSYITPPSATHLSHFPPFKCNASWISAVQRASIGEIKFAPNLVLLIFICVICLLDVWPTVSVVDIWNVLRVLNKMFNSLKESRKFTANKLWLKWSSWTGCLMDYRWVSKAHKNRVMLHLQMYYVVSVNLRGCQISSDLNK